MTTLKAIKNWRLTDELVAVLALITSFVFAENDFFYSLRGIAVAYLFMCIAFRKYEAIRNKRSK